MPTSIFNRQNYCIFSIIFSLTTACFAAEGRNILEEEVSDLEKFKNEVLTLTGRQQINPSSAERVLDEIKTLIDRKKERNQLLAYKASSRLFTVYASTQAMADQHLRIAEETLKDYSTFFPSIIFNPSIPAQILVYPGREDYNSYEGISENTLGHAISNRQKTRTLVRRGNKYTVETNPVSAKKFFRLATFSQDNPYVYVHEVCHILTFDMTNPGEMDIKEFDPPLILNEGLSEFFAARYNPDVFNKRARGLLEAKLPDGEVIPAAPIPNPIKLFTSESYPKDHVKMVRFYSEGTILVRWLMGMPQGSQLMKSLLSAKPEQVESMIRIHRRTNNLSDDAFPDYFAYRQKALDELKAKSDLSPQENVLVTSTNSVPSASKVADKSSPLESELRHQLIQEVANLLQKEKFSELEKMAAEFREKKVCFPGGMWKLFFFYEGVKMSEDQENADRWNYRLQLLERWKSAYPESITAYNALASAYINYAWSARGSSFVNEVKQPEGAKLFKERLSKARSILEAAEKLSVKDPTTYYNLEILARGEGWDRSDFEALFKKGVLLEPTYYPIFFHKAFFLMPFWHGKKGDIEKFADEEAELTKQQEGESLYARIAWSLLWTEDNEFFKYYTFSWPRIKQGFLDIEKRYPSSSWNLNGFCWMACLAGDQETARELFKRIGDQVEIPIWKTRGRYEAWEKWADGNFKIPASWDDERSWEVCF